MRKRFVHAKPIIDVNMLERPVADEPVMAARGAVETPFWDVINGLGWRVPSDGPIDDAAIRRKLAGLPRTFMDEYWRHYRTLHTILDRDGVFTRHNISEVSQARIISHFIAMGHDVYSTVCTKLSVVDFLVGENDFHSFAKYIATE